MHPARIINANAMAKNCFIIVVFSERLTSWSGELLARIMLEAGCSSDKNKDDLLPESCLHILSFMHNAVNHLQEMTQLFLLRWILLFALVFLLIV